MRRAPVHAAVSALALASSLAGCSGGGGGGGGTATAFTVQSATATANPELADDRFEVAFTHDVDAADAVAPAHWLVESPIGTRIDLSGAVFGVSGSRVSLTLSQTGAAAWNLSPHSSFRVVVTGLHDSRGQEIAPGSLVAGVVEGTNAPPVLASISPGTGPAAGGTTITLRGTGFTAPSALVVQVGDGTATGVARVDGETLTAVTPLGSSGPADVSVRTQDGSSTLAGAFTYRMTLTAISPSEGTAGGGTRVTLQGSGFRAGSTVTFGGVPAASIDAISSTSIVATTPEHLPATVDVVVTSGSDAATLTAAYRFRLVVASATPSSGPAAGGTTVAIAGAGFVPGGTTVSFGAFPSPQVTVLDSRDLQAVTPVGAPGPADVVVASSGDIATLPGGFTFRTTIDSVSPAEGPVAGGTFVVIVGSGFTTTTDTTVVFGGAVATGAQVLDPTTITATSPPGTGGPVTVTVQNSAGAASLPAGFTYLEAPTLTSVSPDRGGTGGGYPATLQGSGLSPTMQVRFGSNLATDLRGVDPLGHVATVTVPRGSLGSVDVSVRTSIGDSTLPGGFTYATPFPLFDASIDQVSGMNPMDVAVGDLNGDGALDAIVPDFEENVLAVYLGHGDGSLDFAQALPSGAAAPISVALADIDGDGDLDAAVVNRNAASPEVQANVSIFTNDGTGRLALSTTYGVGQGPDAVRLADFDGDGVVDMAFINRNADPGQIQWRRGLGDGTFDRTRNTFSLPCGSPSAPVSMAVGDMNGDGLPDLAIVDSGTSSVTIAIATGSVPLFAIPEGLCYIVAASAGATPQRVAVGDLDGDGNLDVVTSNLREASVSVLLGDGHGRLGSTRTFPTGASAGSRPLGLAVADFDGDGLADVITVELETDTMSFLKGDGHGGLALPVLRQVGDRPGAVAIGDFDRDGRTDAIVVSQSSDTVSVLRGSPTGPVSAEGITVGQNPSAGVSADLNHDGWDDVVVTNQDEDSIDVFANDRTGRLVLARTLLVRGGAGPSDVVVADFDGDGNLDLCVSGQFSNSVFVFLGTGDFGFGPPQETVFDASFPIALATGDWNQDGAVDIAVALEGTDTIVWLGDGSGHFFDGCPTPPGPGHCHLGAGLSPLVLRAGEFTGDGLLDLAAFGPAGGGGNFVVFEGNGDGIFRQPLPNFDPVFQIVAGDVGDIDGDGDLDAIACGSDIRLNTDSRALIFVNDGTGHFTRTDISVAHDPRSALLRDLNGDGSPDIVLGNFPLADVSVLLSDGTGRFTGPLFLYGASAFPIRVFAADLDHRGGPEVLTVNNGARMKTPDPSRSLSILRNRS
jgi:IPT/TIG domain-containing protein/VCBS repeat protein